MDVSVHADFPNFCSAPRRLWLSEFVCRWGERLILLAWKNHRIFLRVYCWERLSWIYQSYSCYLSTRVDWSRERRSSESHNNQFCTADKLKLKSAWRTLQFYRCGPQGHGAGIKMLNTTEFYFPGFTQESVSFSSFQKLLPFWVLSLPHLSSKPGMLYLSDSSASITGR